MKNWTSDPLMELRTAILNRSTAAVVGETGILLAINILALAGNLLICVAYYRSYKLHSVTNILIVTLSVNDLLISTAAMPLSAAALCIGKWPFSHIVCKAQGFLAHVLAFLSLEIMALTAVNRYLRVFKPSLFRKIFTRKQTTITVIFASAFTLAFFVGLLFLAKSNIIFHPGKAICVLTFKSISQSRIFTAVSSLLFVILPASIITICYFKVFRSIKQHNHAFSTKHQARNAPARLNVVEITVTRTVFTIVAVFFITWIPCFLIDLTDTMYSDNLPRQVYMTYTYLAFASSAANPVIYGVMNKTFRLEFYKLIFCCSDKY